MSLCTISGSAQSPSGALIEGDVIIIRPSVGAAFADGAVAVIPKTTRVVVGAGSTVSFSLYSGRYVAQTVTERGADTWSLWVPDAASASFAECLSVINEKTYTQTELDVLVGAGMQTFTDTAEGLAATTNGKFFMVPAAPTGLAIYENVAGVATVRGSLLPEARLADGSLVSTAVNTKAVADLAALAALDTAQYQAAIVKANGTTYVWWPGNWTSFIAAANPRFVTPATDATGASGAWIATVNAKLLVSGTAAAPSVASSTDPNTGMYWTNDDELGWSAGGVQRMLLGTTNLSVSVPIQGLAVTQSQNDTTAHRLMKVGDAGWMTTSPPLVPSSLDSITMANGLYRTTSVVGAETPGTYPAGLGVGFNASGLLENLAINGGSIFQRFTSNATLAVWTRRYLGSWTAWKQLATTDDVATAITAAVKVAHFNTRSLAIAATVAATVQELVVLQSGSLLSYKRTAVTVQAAITTNAGTVKWAPKDNATPRHWGAAGNGVADDTSAVTACLLSGLAVVDDPGFIYKCPAGVSASPISNLFIRGLTILVASTTAGGLVLTPTGATIIDIDDTSITNSLYSTTGSGLHIAHTEAVCLNNRWKPLVRIGGGVRISGTADDVGGFINLIELVNVNAPEIGPASLTGKRDLTQAAGSHERMYYTGSRGVYLRTTGTASSVNHDLTSPHIRGVETGIWAEGSLEGLSVIGGQIVNVRYGVLADWDEGGSVVNPGLLISGCHINARDRCVKAANVFEARITGCEFYRFSSVTGATLFYAIEGTNMDRSIITGNTINGDPNSDKTSNSRAMSMIGCKRSIIADNWGNGLDMGIYVTGTAPGATEKMRIRDNDWGGLADQCSPTTPTNYSVAWSY